MQAVGPMPLSPILAWYEGEVETITRATLSRILHGRHSGHIAYTVIFRDYN